MNTEKTLAECDFNLWECLTVSSHNTHTVITDGMIGQIKSLNGVQTVFRIGSYGMELVVIVDTEECRKESLISEIQSIIANDQHTGATNHQ